MSKTENRLTIGCRLKSVVLILLGRKKLYFNNIPNYL